LLHLRPSRPTQKGPAQKGPAQKGPAQKGAAQKGAAQKSAAQKSAAPAPPTLPVTGASLMVAGSDTPLWSFRGNAELSDRQHHEDELTALVVLQHVSNLNTVFTQNDWDAASADSQIGPDPRASRMTVHDLLVACCCRVPDDAAEDLAYNRRRRLGCALRGDDEPDRACSACITRTTRRRSGSIRRELLEPGRPRAAGRLHDARVAVLPPDGGSPRTRPLTSGRYVRHIVNTETSLRGNPWIRGIKRDTPWTPGTCSSQRAGAPGSH